MFETCSELVKFLDQNGMYKSSKALKDEMENYIRNGGQQQNIQNKNLMRLINNALSEQQKQQRQNQVEQQQQYYNNSQKKQPNLFSQEETENIMEKLMNRLVASPNLLEDEKLNAKIERFFDNQTFQKMVEGTDVFQDISNLSFTNSYLQKNQKHEHQNKTQTSNSLDIEPGTFKFGQNMQGNENVLNNYDNQQFNTPKNETNQKQQQQEFDDQLFVTDQDQNKSEQAEKQQINFNKFNEENQKIIDSHPDGRMPSMIRAQGNDDSSFLQHSQSLILDQLQDMKQCVDEYIDDDDPGFDLYEVSEREFGKVSVQLAERYGFPDRAVHFGKKREQKKQTQNNNKNQNQQGGEEDSAVLLRGLLDKKKDNKGDGNDEKTEENNVKQGGEQEKQTVGGEEERGQLKKKGFIYLPENLKHPQSEDQFYPVEYDKVIYDCFNLKVIYDRERTGFEETKEFPIVINSIIGGRYQILEYLGSAAFSKAIQCLDLVTNKMLCMKIIENNKDYFDQSIDEIKLLKYINFNGDVDENNVLRMYDYFYHKEHLFIVTELLKDNLYEFYKFNREQEAIPYFTLGKLQRITKQILTGLDYIHSLHLIHCDLKPENILMKSYSKVQVKIIDFGSSCFIHDHLSSYVQSRSYRAPEVIIGCKYDYKIDMWSLGCILAELWTGNVLFQNESVQGLLSRVIGIIGAFPDWMFKEGRLVQNFFTKEKLLYQEVYEDGEYSQNFNETSDMGQRKRNKTGRIQILVPKKTNLSKRLKTDDAMFIDFVKQLLQIDYTKRPSAKEAMNHPWLTMSKYQDGLQ